MTRALAVSAIILTMILVGCSSHADRTREIRSDYYAGKPKAAEQKLDKAIAKNDRDVDVLKLDKAMILMMDGRTKEAETLFKQVRDRFDALEGKDGVELAKSMLSDDQQLAYAGEDYEKVMIRFMLALCNLMHDGSDARAYALQVNQKQAEIIQKSTSKGPDGKNLKEGYKYVPAGAYLHAALCEETHTNYDDAARSLQQVASWQPDLKFVQQDLERVTKGKHSQPGHGVVYVFAMVGKGPVKVEAAEPVSQISMLIADRIFSAVGKHTLPPTIAPVKVPVVAPINALMTLSQIPVVVDSSSRGSTSTLTDVHKMAYDQCLATMPEVVGRAVARRVIKKGAIYAAKEAVKTDKGSLGSVALDIAGVAWEATENADTRCWSLLPSHIQVLRVELPVGQHSVQMANTNIRVNVEDGRNTYVVANFPDINQGKVITNKPAK